MEEIWKDIPEYEGLYQVSNIGRVKSLKFEGHIDSAYCEQGISEKDWEWDWDFNK